MKYKRLPVDTKASDINANVGDLFIVMGDGHHAYGEGCVIKLDEDDGSYNPYFKYVTGKLVNPDYSEVQACINFEYLAILYQNKEPEVMIEVNGKVVYISRESAKALNLID